MSEYGLLTLSQNTVYLSGENVWVPPSTRQGTRTSLDEDLDGLFCGSIADRDENAAKNILQRSLQVLAGTPPSLRKREGPEPSGESPLPLKREAAGL